MNGYGLEEVLISRKKGQGSVLSYFLLFSFGMFEKVRAPGRDSTTYQIQKSRRNVSIENRSRKELKN